MSIPSKSRRSSGLVSLLLCGGAFLMTSAPAFAQQKPATTENVCGGSPTLVLGNPDSYDCGSQSASYDLICQVNGQTVDDTQCGQGFYGVDLNSDAAQAFAAANPGYTVGKRGDGYNDYYATGPLYPDAAHECSIPHDYEWTTSPDTAGLCGNQTVNMNPTCIDKDQGNAVVDSSKCDYWQEPAATKQIYATGGCSYQFVVGAWSLPPSSCGQAQEMRDVKCQDSSGQVLPSATACTDSLNREATAASAAHSYTGSNPKTFSYGGQTVFTPDMPTACDLDDPAQIANECQVVVVDSASSPAFAYVVPMQSATFNDGRSCTNPQDYPTGYQWNTPIYTPQGSTCGQSLETADDIYCEETATGARVSDTLCDPSKKPQATKQITNSAGCQAVSSAACGVIPDWGNGFGYIIDEYGEETVTLWATVAQWWPTVASDFGYRDSQDNVTINLDKVFLDLDGGFTFCSEGVQWPNSGKDGINWLENSEDPACNLLANLPSCEDGLIGCNIETGQGCSNTAALPGTQPPSTPPQSVNLCTAKPTEQYDCQAAGYDTFLKQETVYTGYSAGGYYDCTAEEAAGQCCQVESTNPDGTSSDSGAGWSFVRFYKSTTCTAPSNPGTLQGVG